MEKRGFYLGFVFIFILFSAFFVSAPNSVNVTDEQFTQGFQGQISDSQALSVNFEGVAYTIGFGGFDGQSAVILIHPNNGGDILFRAGFGESIKVDLNSDNILDLTLEYKGITNGGRDTIIFIKKISENAPAQVINSAPPGNSQILNEPAASSTSSSHMIIFYIIIFVLVAAIVIIIIFLYRILRDREH